MDGQGFSLFLGYTLALQPLGQDRVVTNQELRSKVKSNATMTGDATVIAWVNVSLEEIIEGTSRAIPLLDFREDEVVPRANFGEDRNPIRAGRRDGQAEETNESDAATSGIGIEG